MKNLKWTLLAAAAALGLQACDVSVQPSASQDTAATTQPALATAESTASTAAADPSAITSSSAPAAAPADASAGLTTPAMPASPDTNAMGAAAPAADATSVAAPAAADGVAAPTELARFLDENPPQAPKKEARAEGTKSGDGKSGSAQADARTDAVQGKS